MKNLNPLNFKGFFKKNQITVKLFFDYFAVFVKLSAGSTVWKRKPCRKRK